MVHYFGQKSIYILKCRMITIPENAIASFHSAIYIKIETLFFLTYAKMFINLFVEYTFGLLIDF